MNRQAVATAPVGIGDAADVANTLLGHRGELELASRHVSLTGEHLRYRRLAADGTRVVDREVSVHLDGAGGRWARAKVLGEPARPVTLVGERRITAAIAEARASASVAEGRVVQVAVEAVALPSRDPEIVRAGYRAIVETREPAHGWEVWVDGDGNAEIVRDIYKFADGSGLVFDPSPLARTGDMTMVDGNDATTPAIDAARDMVTLPRLDGTGVLRGQFADVKQSGQRAQSANLMFAFTRTDDRFEEVNAYYHLDAAQARLQALGFTNANNRVQVASVNDGNQDNSFYSPQTKEISMGAGGVDDAEDGDIVVHEYGHSVQDNIVPGFGVSHEAGAMGEGFGDLLAASVVPADAAHTQAISRACIGAWDATSYDDRMPPCLRRIDGTRHWPEHAASQVHADGEIWSASMWSMYQSLGDPALGLKLVVEAFFRVAPDTTFQAYSDALIETDMVMNGGANIPKIEQALWQHGLSRKTKPESAFTGTPTPMTVDLGPPASPLGDNVDESLTINHPGAGAIRVHFSMFAMEEDANCVDNHCDNVYIFDGAGNLYGVFGGAQPAFDGPIVPGDTVVVRWVTDGSQGSMGFRIDRYDYGAGGGGGDGGAPDDGGIGGPEAGIDNDNNDDGDGGGCCDAGGGADASVLFGLLGLAWITRRRRPLPNL